MVLAWLFNSESWNKNPDPREDHKTDPLKIVTLSFLSSLGIRYWNIDADAYQQMDLLDQIAERNGWVKRDAISLSEEVPGYEDILKHGFEEHLHEDPEVRYVVRGSGYYDVRSSRDNEWVRIHFQKGDLIVIPAGQFHRFTLDTNNYIEVVRLFTEKPRWKPHQDTEQTAALPVRRQYQSKFNGKLSFNGTASLNNTVGARKSLFPAMRRANGQIYLSGVLPYRHDTDRILAGASYIVDNKTEQKELKVDVRQQTQACLENMKLILNQHGAGLEHLVTLTIYIVEGARLDELNEMYARYFDAITGPCRTCVFVSRLQHTQALVEMTATGLLPESVADGATH